MTSLEHLALTSKSMPFTIRLPESSLARFNEVWSCVIPVYKNNASITPSVFLLGLTILARANPSYVPRVSYKYTFLQYNQLRSAMVYRKVLQKQASDRSRLQFTSIVSELPQCCSDTGEWQIMLPHIHYPTSNSSIVTFHRIETTFHQHLELWNNLNCSLAG